MVEIMRLYSDDNGDSLFDTHEISLNLVDDAPPAKPHYFSDPEHAESFVVVECPVGWGEGSEMHPTPRRQIVSCLSGSMRITTSLGDSRDLKAGDTVLLEDTSGKGHASLVTSPAPFRGLIVRLE